MRSKSIFHPTTEGTAYDWGAMTWHMDDGKVAGANVSVATMTVLPGKTSPAHRHNNVNEVIHVISGSTEQRVGDEWFAADEGSTVFVPEGAVHQTRNATAEPVTLLVTYSGGSRHYEEVDS